MPVSLKHFKAGSEYPVPEAGKMRFYSMQFCPYAQRTRLLLLLKNIEHETVNINLSNKPEWYMEKVTPLGKVPCIQLDDLVIYDSAIINDYLDETYPGRKLNPADPYQRAQDRMLLEHWGKVITPFYDVFRTNGDVKEAVTRLLNAIDEIEKVLAKKGTPFFGGDELKMIDIMMWPHAIRSKLYGDYIPEAVMERSRYPCLMSWFETMSAIPEIKATEFSSEYFKIFVKSVVDRDVQYDLGL